MHIVAPASTKQQKGSLIQAACPKPDDDALFFPLSFPSRIRCQRKTGSKPLVSPPPVIEGWASVQGQENFPLLTWGCPWPQN